MKQIWISLSLLLFTLAAGAQTSTRQHKVDSLYQLIPSMDTEEKLKTYDKLLRWMTSSRDNEDIVGAYLLKDILVIDGLKNSGKMKDLLRLIAFQLGNLNPLSIQTTYPDATFDVITKSNYLHYI